MSAEWSPTAFYNFGDVVTYQGAQYALTVAGSAAVVGAPPANSMSWITPPPPAPSTIQQKATSIAFRNITSNSAVIELIYPAQQSLPSATVITVTGSVVPTYNVNYALGLIYLYGLSPSTLYGNFTITFGTNSQIYPTTFTTTPAPPAPITAVVVTAVADTSCSISWTGGGDPSLGNYVFLFNNLEILPIFESYGGGVGSANFNSLTPLTNYILVINYTDNYGNSVSSTPVSFSTTAVPPAPPAITQPVITGFTNVTPTSFQVNWTGGSDFSNLYSFIVNSVQAIPASVTKSSAVFTGLTPNTTYIVYVKVNNGVVNYTSAPDGVTTANAGSQLTPITNVQAVNVSTRSFTVTWSGGSTSKPDYTFTLNGSPISPNSYTASSATFSGLTINTSYVVVIIASNGINSVRSAPLTVKTLSIPLTSLYVVNFLLYDGTQWVICQQQPSDIGQWYLTGPLAGQIRGNTGQNAITYLKGLQAQGCKIILSMGGGGLSQPILATMFADPVATARSINAALLTSGVNANLNPLGFAKTNAAWQDFAFDGLDMDVEVNTPKPDDQFNVLATLRGLAPTTILTAAPQAPNLIAANTFGGNGNGSWYPFPHVYPSDTLANYNTADGTGAWMYPPSMRFCGLDYIFVQFYNQGPSWYPGTPGTSFPVALAMWGWLCVKSQSTLGVGAKVVLGFATNDGNPIWDPAQDSDPTNTAITTANALIVQQGGIYADVVPSMWLAGWGAWNSPTANSVAAYTYSPAGQMINLPADATMLYMANQQNCPNPGWAGPVPYTL